jgi:multidrug efflux pump
VQDTGLIVGVTEAPQTISFAGLVERQQALVKALVTDPAVRACRRSSGWTAPT